MNAARHTSDAVLLAAGRGKRLRPHTDTTPKPLLPVAGRPTLDYLLQQLHEAGISDAILVTHHLSDQIDDYLQTQPWPLTTRSTRQQNMCGTADALLSALSEDNSANLLVSATDYIVDSDFYRNFLEFHSQHDCEISVSLKKMPEHELAARSSVAVDEHMNISRIVEKPAPGEAPSLFSANLIYILPSGFRPYLLEVKPSARGEYEIQDAINRFLQHGGRAKGLVQPEPEEWHPGFLTASDHGN